MGVPVNLWTLLHQANAHWEGGRVTDTGELDLRARLLAKWQKLFDHYARGVHYKFLNIWHFLPQDLPRDFKLQ